MAKTPTLSRRRWSRQTAAHLAVRAGFGPTPTQLDQLEQLDPDEAVDLFLTYSAEKTRTQTPDWYHETHAKHRSPKGLEWKELKKLEPEERQKLQKTFRKKQNTQLQRTREWWLQRMVQTPTPLEEKLTLFWHGHFATSFKKVKCAYPMLEQNMTFREQGQGNWNTFLIEMSKDPAMLVYLDNARSKKRKPNENYARELLELFSLGEGNYSEDDIKNAARAFSGWSLKSTEWEFKERTRQLDEGEKTFMDASGPLRGEDIIREITRQPQASDFLAERLWSFFASETPNKNAMADISRTLRGTNFDLNQGLRVLFTHEDFYHPSVIRGQIKSPVQLCVHLARTLNEASVPPGKMMARGCQQLGQKLFEPPSVKGWDGGAAWITASTLSLRYRFSSQLVRMKQGFNVDTLLPDRTLNREQVREVLFDRFYHSPLRVQERTQMDHYLAQLPPASEWKRHHVVQVLEHLVQQPQFQLT